MRNRPKTQTSARGAQGRGPSVRDPGEELLAEILLAPDRDPFPGAHPVVSVREQEEPQYLEAIEGRELSRVPLSRRGVWHGEWAELDAEAVRGLRSRGPERTSTLAERLERWHAARPIVLPGVACSELSMHAGSIADARTLHATLEEKGGLRRRLAAIAPALEPDYQLLPARAKLFDPERDLERVGFASVPPLGRGRKVDDLWVKSSWLSTFEGDASMRLRVAFGQERDDDASGDLLRHRLVADLASRILPESALVSVNPELVREVERMIGGPALFTQHIAYWNSPDGGALFHHDGFARDPEEAGALGQLGVCYLQITGRTAWLALSIADLGRRVSEFVSCLGEGELPWVAAQLFPDAASRARLADLTGDESALEAELAQPGCGFFCGLVNRGPEFTAWLADAGHAAILSPGDAILLPNHGLTRTAMHSVFCAGEETAYGLSLAIRADREFDGIASP